MYPVYTPTTYNITYVCGEAENNYYNPTSYTVESATTVLGSPTPNHVGYTFAGWFTSPTYENNTRIYSILSGTYGNLTIYAKWINYCIESAEGFTFDYTNFELPAITMVVTNSKTLLTLSTVIQVSEGCSWQLSYDIEGTQLIKTKNISLEIGENIRYVTVWYNENEEYNVVYILAVYRLDMFEYSFMDGEIQYGSSITAEEYSSVAKPTTNPQKTGYTFLGWRTDNSNGVVEFPYILRKPTTFYSVYEANNYTATFVTDEKAEQVKPKLATYDESFSMPIPIKKGYTFDYWTLNDNRVDNNFIWQYTSDMRFVAHFIANEYTIYFRLGSIIVPDYGNIVSPDIENELVSNFTLTVTYDEEFELPYNKAQASGFNFTGFTLSGETFTNGVWNLLNDITLDLNYEIIVYNLIYHLNGGTNNSNNPATYTVADEITLGTPTKTGYTFNGWFTTSDFEYDTQIRKITIGTIEDISLYAKFTPNTYKITYITNGGTVESTTQTVTYDSEYTLYEISKLGFTFTGYTYNGDEFTNGTWKLLNDITITANWEIATYNLTIILNGGTDNTDYPETYTVEDEITLGTPIKTGYTFKGWFTTENFASGTDISKINKGSARNISLYAKFTPNTYKITYITNGGTVENTTQIVTYDSEYTLYEISKTGYIFTGFTYNGEEFTNGTWKILNDITITANWEIATYSIIYETNGGTNNLANPESYTFEDNEITLKDPTKIGYTFKGWFTTENFASGTKITKISKGSTGNISLYANWEVTKYLVTYMYNGKQVKQDEVEYDSSYTVANYSPKQNYEVIKWLADNNEEYAPENNFTYILLNNLTFNAIMTAYVSTDFTITISNNKASITGYTGSDPDVIIPEYIKKDSTYYKVTSISSSAFENKTKLTSITISNSVTSIGEYAFRNCYNLVEVYDLSSLNITKGSSYDGYVGYYAKDIYTSLDSDSKLYYAENGVIYYVNENIFEVVGYNGNSNEIVLDSGTTSIKSYAFFNCTSLTSVTIPNSVTSIGDYAFKYCYNLTSVTIGNSVTSIGKEAFYNCTSLTSVTIGNSVTSIGSDAFSGCSSLTAVYITSIEAWCNIQFGSASANPLYYAKNLYLNENKVTNLVIPDSVTEIKPYSFYNCSSLTCITIPDSVTSIGSDAFSGCSNLTAVYITNIEAWCNIQFSGVSENPLYHAKNLYINENKVTDLVIPDTVTKIKSYAFSGCSCLVSITIPDSVTSIGDYAFSGCSNLTAVYITNIEAWCNIQFGSPSANPLCYAKNLYINENKVTDLVIPDTVTKIKSYAFYNCSGLTSITIPDSVTSIGYYAFYGCRSLTSVTIPDSVTSIGSSAFNNCSSLASITIGNSVTSIGSSAFSGCGSLTSITIPDSVTSIGESAFSGCSNLTAVYITNIEAWCNIQFGSDSANPLCYAKNLYLNENKVTDLVIPDTVTKIKSCAFSGCSSLTSVTIPDSVTSIGEDAFRYCSSLTSVTIPDSVTSIGSSAFSGCNLTSVTIPNSVTSIGSSAFYNCSSLTAVYYKGTVEDWEKISIDSYNSNLTSAERYYYKECVHDNNQWTYDEDGNITTEITVSEWVIDKEPTCTEDGLKHGECFHCGKTVEVVISALGHSVDEQGNCSVCNKDLGYVVANDTNYPFSEENGVLSSTNHTDSSSSSYVITAKTNIVITFEYLVSSESGYDYFYILHNTTQKVKASGTSSSYTSFTITLNANETLTFKYTKDESNSSGNDRCYIRNLTVTLID